MSWQTITDDREKYKAYLCSREWALLRNAVRERCGGKCERCELNDMECVHHLTYARKYDELIEDLAGWCNACHEFTHGKSDYDPRRTIYPDGVEFTKQCCVDLVENMIAEQGINPSVLFMAILRGPEVIESMGSTWFLDAADGKFMASAVDVSDLQKLITARRQEQGI